MKSIALVWLSFVVLLGASQAAESEIPNIVSSWKTASGAYAKAVTEFKKNTYRFISTTFTDWIQDRKKSTFVSRVCKKLYQR